MNLDSFSHGQITSKLWLCEELEKYLPESGVKMLVLGSWYSVLSFMLLTRNQMRFDCIHGIDIDAYSVYIADKVTDAWVGSGVVRNIEGDAEIVSGSTLDQYDVIVNCSVEHFESNTWYDRVRPGTLVCIQSSDVTLGTAPWLVKQPNPTFGTFVDRFSVTNCMYSGVKRIQYPSFGYNRFMVIGQK